MIEELVKYAHGMECDADVIEWINTHAKPYIQKNNPDQSEVEHIIDYMASDKRPKRISKMSYVQAKGNTDKWNKALIKKGNNIEEKPEDVEVVKKWRDGFKIVKLVGENAYKREGALMRHCVASYYGSSKAIYSLRDKDNMPHCTMEHGQQVKGKGNGAIHPKYIKYVVAFLEEIGMHVGQSEMRNLGYINVEKLKPQLGATKNKFFNKVYLYEGDTWLDKKGEEYAGLDLWDYKPLIAASGEVDIKINFTLSAFVPKAVTSLIDCIKPKNKKSAASGNYSKLAASGYNSQLAASGNYSKLAASGDDSKLAASGYRSQLAASGNYSQLAASGDDSKLAASGDDSKLAASGYNSQLAASGNYSQLAASGYNSKLAASGNYSQLAASGYNSKLAASGNYSKLAASGYRSKLAASGNYSKLAASGYRSQLAASGYRSVVSGVGRWSRVKGVKGTLVSLVHYDDDYKPVKFTTGKIGENGLKPDTWYTLDSSGEFVEAA